MASALDAMAMRMWQASGGKGPRPCPIRRPGAGSSELETTSLSQSQVIAALRAIGPQGPNT